MTVADWQEQLAGLSGDDVSKGLGSLPESWPPTVNEFKRLCLGLGPDDLHRSAAYLPWRENTDVKALPQKADKWKAQQALANHRRMLSGALDAREKQRQLDDAKRLLFGGDHNG